MDSGAIYFAIAGPIVLLLLVSEVGAALLRRSFNYRKQLIDAKVKELSDAYGVPYTHGMKLSNDCRSVVSDRRVSRDYARKLV